ncbi:GNAT family N-acetyltransferase [Terrisporobacter glycolicus]|uniref:GNAT family N-acetyltransferase n=1 Tax=Terrisporobacter glycolicus TaxID=36841 RepID=UPI003464C0C0
MLSFAFNELKAHKVLGMCHCENKKSASIMEKAGMSKQDVFREEYLCGGVKMLEVEFATMSDFLSLMELVRLVSWNFPGLETEENILDYERTLHKNINRQSAICAKENSKVVGILLFSTKHNVLSCMAVHPGYRRRSIARQMISMMFTKLDITKDITVTTFREYDERGIAPRELYKKLGFLEGELIKEFDYPLQKLILHAK